MLARSLVSAPESFLPEKEVNSIGVASSSNTPVVDRMVKAAQLWFAEHPDCSIVRLSKEQDRALNDIMMQSVEADLVHKPDFERAVIRLQALGLVARAQVRAPSRRQEHA